MFENDGYDLPDALRPDCHRLKITYKSVYGRLRWDASAQTVTSGFSSMGQGRYVHPSERQTIAPHEAARLEFIPDFFDLSAMTTRTGLAEIIGNVVPPELSYAVAVDLLR